MGPGAYVTALETASKRESKDTLVCGKPSVAFYKTCLSHMREEGQSSEEEERNIIIGDDIEADLGGGAIEMGLERVLGESILCWEIRKGLRKADMFSQNDSPFLCHSPEPVQTGKYRQGDEERTSKPVQVYRTFADFVEQELFAKGILVG
jgi:hypothetical protein